MADAVGQSGQSHQPKARTRRRRPKKRALAGSGGGANGIAACHHPIKHPCAHIVATSVGWQRLRMLLNILALVVAGGLTFYDPQQASVVTATDALVMPLLLAHCWMNTMLIVDLRNPPTSAGCGRLALNIGYELLKVVLIVVNFSLSLQQQVDARLPQVLLLLLIGDSMRYFVVEFQTPHSIAMMLRREWYKVAWLLWTLFLCLYGYAFLGYYLFHEIQPSPLTPNLRGDEFQDIVNSFITMVYIMDSFDGYQIRNFRKVAPYSPLFFITFWIISYCIILNLVMAVIVSIFEDFRPFPPRPPPPPAADTDATAADDPKEKDKDKEGDKGRQQLQKLSIIIEDVKDAPNRK